MKKQTILQTLHYADIFDYPLRIEEIHTYLIEPLKIDVLEKALSQIDADNKLIYANSYYCLSGREEIIELRKRREKWSQPKLKKAKKIASTLKFIPWVKLIGVTGALAMKNSDEGDDIDLIIITSSKRLWLTRGLVVTFLLSTGQYRRANKIKDRVCPNLMLSEDTLKFSNHNLFTAHEIVQMKPIFCRGNTYQKFLQANSWIKDFLPNAIGISNLKPAHRQGGSQMSKNATLAPFGRAQLKSQNFLLNFLEKCAYKLQLKYMSGKKTTEVTTPFIIRFHPNDIRQKVLREYQKRKSLVY